MLNPRCRTFLHARVIPKSMSDTTRSDDTQSVPEPAASAPRELPHAGTHAARRPAKHRILEACAYAWAAFLFCMLGAAEDNWHVLSRWTLGSHGFWAAALPFALCLVFVSLASCAYLGLRMTRGRYALILAAGMASGLYLHMWAAGQTSSAPLQGGFGGELDAAARERMADDLRPGAIARVFGPAWEGEEAFGSDLALEDVKMEFPANPAQVQEKLDRHGLFWTNYRLDVIYRERMVPRSMRHLAPVRLVSSYFALKWQMYRRHNVTEGEAWRPALAMRNFMTEMGKAGGSSALAMKLLQSLAERDPDPELRALARTYFERNGSFSEMPAYVPPPDTPSALKKEAPPAPDSPAAEGERKLAAREK